MNRLARSLAPVVALVSLPATAQPTAPNSPPPPAGTPAPAPPSPAPVQPAAPAPVAPGTPAPGQPGQPAAVQPVQPAQPAPVQPGAPPPAQPAPGQTAPAPYAYPAPGYYAPAPYTHEPPPPVNVWPQNESVHLTRFRLAAISESAFSADEGPFYNHLLGGRFDYRFTIHSSLGLYLAYANLKGTQSRVHSMLGLLQYEYRFYFGQTQRFAVPTRVGVGHLARNGTPVRFSAGFFYSLDDAIDIGADIIAPMFWPASGDTVISMNLSAEVSVSF